MKRKPSTSRQTSTQICPQDTVQFFVFQLLRMKIFIRSYTEKCYSVLIKLITIFIFFTLLHDLSSFFFNLHQFHSFTRVVQFFYCSCSFYSLFPGCQQSQPRRTLCSLNLYRSRSRPTGGEGRAGHLALRCENRHRPPLLGEQIYATTMRLTSFTTRMSDWERHKRRRILERCWEVWLLFLPF